MEKKEIIEPELPLDMDRPWSTTDVLKKLIWASKYLLNEKSYDGGNYEEIEICIKRAEEILASLESLVMEKCNHEWIGTPAGFVKCHYCNIYQK